VLKGRLCKNFSIIWISLSPKFDSLTISKLNLKCEIFLYTPMNPQITDFSPRSTSETCSSGGAKKSTYPNLTNWLVLTNPSPLVFAIQFSHLTNTEGSVYFKFGGAKTLGYVVIQNKVTMLRYDYEWRWRDMWKTFAVIILSNMKLALA
jgi:hypothetical protein